MVEEPPVGQPPTVERLAEIDLLLAELMAPAPEGSGTVGEATVESDATSEATGREGAPTVTLGRTTLAAADEPISLSPQNEASLSEQLRTARGLLENANYRARELEQALAGLRKAKRIADDSTETLKRTYRYLRIVLISTVPVIYLALWLVATFSLADGVELPTVSHFYYTPAGVVFAGALVAAAAALLALSGTGWERGLLIIAAFFAPLIAFLPTPLSASDLEMLDRSCASGENPCIPEPFDTYVDISFIVWLSVVAAALLVAATLTIRSRRPGQPIPRSAWIIGGSVAALLVAYLLWYLAWKTLDDTSFSAYAHVVSASTFFAIITAVAVNQARKKPFRSQARIASGKTDASTGQKAVRIITGAIAVLMVIDLIPVALIFLKVLDSEEVGTLVFWVEVIGLGLFGIFWILQTSRKWKDPDA